MTESLFDQNDNQDPSLDPAKNYLDELVGEGKKFKDAAALARGKAEADLTIELMKKRSDELRAEYIKVADENRAQAKLQELLDRIEKNPNRNTPDLDTHENRVETPVFDPKQLESLVDSRIQETERNRKSTDNFNTVQAKLKERFGNNVGAVLKERAAELGLEVADIDTLARKSPTAFFNTLGLNDQPSDNSFTPPRSSIRNDNFGPSKTQKRTWSYYQDLKKANPKLYFDPKIAVQMQKDAVELGDAFNDGDFNLN